MPWICAMFGWLSDASVFASRSNRINRSVSRANESDSTVDRDAAVELGVTRQVDFAHATSADGGDNLMRAELCTRAQGHVGGQARRLDACLPSARKNELAP